MTTKARSGIAAVTCVVLMIAGCGREVDTQVERTASQQKQFLDNLAKQKSAIGKLQKTVSRLEKSLDRAETKHEETIDRLKESIAVVANVTRLAEEREKNREKTEVAQKELRAKKAELLETQIVAAVDRAIIRNAQVAYLAKVNPAVRRQTLEALEVAKEGKPLNVIQVHILSRFPGPVARAAVEKYEESRRNK